MMLDMTLVNLAKMAVESYVNRGEIISPSSESPEEFLTKRAGAFVTIERNGQLRGCIGTYLPVQENIAGEVVNNAVAAATEDYRFGPIQKEELPHLSYTVYILNKPELVLIKEASDPPKFFFEKLKRAGLNPKKYGIIIKTAPITQREKANDLTEPPQDVVFNGHSPFKSGLLLPDLEGVDSVEQQISIACRKGGINPAREKIFIYRFTVEKYQ